VEFEKQLNADLDIDVYSRALISVPWGTVWYWLKGMLSTDDLERTNQVFTGHTVAGRDKKIERLDA
jgi:hypothetical protein